LPLTREQKNAVIQEYATLLEQSQGLLLADYRGLTVKQMQELRRKARDAGGQVRVVKNTLFRIALEQVGLPVQPEFLVGPAVVGFGGEDMAPLAKAFVDFARSTKTLKVKGGVLGRRVLTASDVEVLSQLPSIEVVRAQLVAAIEGPLTNLVGVITAPLREIAQVLQARAEQGEAA